MNKILKFMRESGPARFFIPAGIFLIIFGVIVFIINNKNQDYIEIPAVVSNVVLAEKEYIDAEGNHVDATYNVDLKYTIDGKEYVGELINVSKYNLGDEVTIYYNPKDPSKITQTKSLVLPIIIIIVGILSLIGGIVSTVKMIKKYKSIKVQ